MYKVRSKFSGVEHEVKFSGFSGTEGTIDNVPFVLDLLKSGNTKSHVIYNNKSYTVEFVNIEPESKTVALKINGRKFEFQVWDRLDIVLKEMGIDQLAGKKVKDLKAPMPGLVLEIMIEEGSAVKQGDAVLILEAMKMENILKSPVDGVIKKIHVGKTNAVEKNQILINFE